MSETSLKHLTSEEMKSLDSRVQKCNARIQELGAAVLHPLTLMGKEVQVPASDENLDKATVHQVAVKTPDGVGVCSWPAVEYYAFLAAHPADHAISRFVPFEKLGDFERSLVASVITEIEEDLSDIAASIAAMKDDSPRISLSEYLKNRIVAS